MKYGINTLDDFDVENKTVLCRMDFNEPIDSNTGRLLDTTRILAGSETISELSNRGARVVILIHQGSDIEYDNFHNTKPHAKVLSEIIGKQVEFIDDVYGPCARDAISKLKNGEIVMLDNVRFMSEEQTLFELNLRLTHEQQTKTQLVQKLLPYIDIYVCDGFAAIHRDQPSLCAFEYLVPSAMGRLFEKEYGILSELIHSAEKPSVFILGGAKIADAFAVIESIFKNNIADVVLTGGLVANIFLISSGIDIGEKSLKFIQDKGFSEYIIQGKSILERYSDRIILPVDLAYVERNVRKENKVENLSKSYIYGDIGENTIKKYKEIILNAKSIFINGPVGIFENDFLKRGSEKIWEYLSETEGFTILGGGDSIKATKQFKMENEINYICTGGGALIRFISGEELPVIKSLRDGAQLFGGKNEDI